MSERLLVLVLAGAGALWAMRNWRSAVKAVLVLLIVEGAIRKWVFPGSQQLVYFGKDILLLGAYAGFFASGRRAWSRVPLLPTVTPLLLISAAWGALQIFNPNLPTPLLGLLGFKSYFLYAPLLFLVPLTFRDDAEVVYFIRKYLLFALPIGLLAAYQFASPSTSSVNAYARSSEDAYVATFGSSEHVRVTATFSFITGYTAYLVAASVLLLSILAAGHWRLRGNVALYAALGLTLLGMLMSGSRGPVFVLVFLLPFFWWLAVMREGDSGSTLGRLVLAVSALAALLITIGEQPLAAFLGRAAGFSDVAGRLTAPFLAPFAALPESGFFGRGIGATHNAAMSVAKTIVPYGWLRGAVFESESARVMVELGLPGFLLIYTLRLALLVLALRTVYSLRTRLHRALAIASFLYLLSGIVGSPVFDPTSGVYYWFFAGLLTLALRLDQSQLVTLPGVASQPQPAPARPATARDGLAQQPSWTKHYRGSW